jgi:hypothetical protein
MYHGSGYHRHSRWIASLLIGLGTGCGANTREIPSEPSPAGLPQEQVVAPIQRQPITYAPSDALDPPAVPEPSPSEPVRAVMACRPSGRVTAELLVAVRIARAHYLHAEADHGGTFTPLGMEATLPAGIEFAGDWAFPPAEAGRAGVAVYRNFVLLRRSLRVASPPPKTLTVTGVLRYQACNDELCWPPGKMELSAPISIRTEGAR